MSFIKKTLIYKEKFGTVTKLNKHDQLCLGTLHHTAIVEIMHKIRTSS